MYTKFVQVEDIQMVDNQVPDDVGDLVKDIKESGLCKPIKVTVDNQLIDGRRRLEACKTLGWKEIPVVVDLDDMKIEILAIDENLTRNELINDLADIRESVEDHDYRIEDHEERVCNLEREMADIPELTESLNEKLQEMPDFSSVDLEDICAKVDSHEEILEHLPDALYIHLELTDLRKEVDQLQEQVKAISAYIFADKESEKIAVDEVTADK